jgi:leucyl aminopeptidase
MVTSALNPDLDSVTTADVIVISYIILPTEASGENEVIFNAHPALVKKIEKLFAVDLRDELSFFSPTGKAGEINEIPASAENSPVEKIILLGVGDQSLAAFRTAGAALGRKVRGAGKNFATIAPSQRDEIIAFATSAALGEYTWNQKTTAKASSSDSTEIEIVTADVSPVEYANVISGAICRARDLIHTPANIKTPLWMASQARAIAAEHGLEINVLSGTALKEFGGLRAVGNSSPKPGPRFIHLSYTPKGRKKAARIPHVVIVGKGITFDTGGISLKRPYDTMMAMKSDMAGAAAALATISTLAPLRAQVKVSVLMMCAENALSGTSQRPSDVIKHYGGKTVEVINTDAEGRLVLADGLAFADINLDPDYVIDIATLTGAATLGLGRQYAAMYTRNTQLARTFSEIGERTGDRVWHMPLIDDYTDGLESDIADFNHTADKGHYGAGSVTAALFLEQFVGDRQWVHLDIAGTARSESDSGENPKGGTGFGVRLLVEWLTSLS